MLVAAVTSRWWPRARRWLFTAGAVVTAVIGVGGHARELCSSYVQGIAGHIEFASKPFSQHPRMSARYRAPEPGDRHSGPVSATKSEASRLGRLYACNGRVHASLAVPCQQRGLAPRPSPANDRKPAQRENYELGFGGERGVEGAVSV